ncbi:SRPBCC domain-containing protein [Actinacidiphila epipremni]|uniref:Carbon monoxide dehydrogenase subunit G n=1 Tax=Actinacidiphila epipremni TaxID=2053013 RepID=A0ABX0ZWV9_9ACTN|nr:SRPBCC domain-containing protein [Actinacidiphila epipremni]NJP47157.1 hypothetical protein [Actinacidiphila epipremni]
MEHESFVPGMTTARMVQALRTPEVVRASLPGWQPDSAAAEGAQEGGADDGTAAVGRLRLRVGGSSVTYRGTLVVSGDGPGFTVSAAGTEVRGGGGVSVAAEVSVVTAVQPEAGVTLVWRAEAEAHGRVMSYEPAVVEATVRRLLDRFCLDLAAHAPAGDVRDPHEAAAAAGSAEAPGQPPAGDAPHAAEEAGPARSGGPADLTQAGEAAAAGGAAPAESAEQADEPRADEPDAPGADDDQLREAEAAAPGAGAADESEEDVVDDTGEPVPGAELEDFDLVEVEVEVPESAAALDDLVPPAEAAHARRTMIGRSAEEVDHAPPRGRYAPVPAPDSSSAAAATLRWAAPVAAALVASAVVVSRVLRRRG